MSALQRSGTSGEDGTLPVVCTDISQCVELLKKGYASVTGGKFAQALADFTSILHSLPLLSVEKQAQVKEVLELREICREYITAMRLEMVPSPSRARARTHTHTHMHAHTHTRTHTHRHIYYIHTRTRLFPG